MTLPAQQPLPVVFLPHGGGPWPFMDTPMARPEENDALSAYLRTVPGVPGVTPKALLVVSAHWEERVPTVMSHAAPPLLFDYSGFPESTYQLRWPAPGQPELAKKVRALLEKAGFETAEDTKRGFDHGTFVPLKVAFPSPEIPVVQLSLVRGLDPAEHLRIGRALQSLRNEGVYIIGSGMTFHNMRGFFDPRADAVAESFDTWLRESTTLPASERDKLLTVWAQAPSARLAHPREEHLLPLMVVAGAAGDDRATVAWNGTFMGKRLSAYHFGAQNRG